MFHQFGQAGLVAGCCVQSSPGHHHGHDHGRAHLCCKWMQISRHPPTLTARAQAPTFARILCSARLTPGFPAWSVLVGGWWRAACFHLGAGADCYVVCYACWLALRGRLTGEHPLTCCVMCGQGVRRACAGWCRAIDCSSGLKTAVLYLRLHARRE